MDILDFEITTDEIQAVGMDNKINIFLKKNDILQLDNFEFKSATRITLDKTKDCDGFNRAYIYENKNQLGLLRVENRIYLDKIGDVTNIYTGEKGRLLNLTEIKPEIKELNEI